jgi:hypothetical protein
MVVPFRLKLLSATLNKDYQGPLYRKARFKGFNEGDSSLVLGGTRMSNWLIIVTLTFHWYRILPTPIKHTLWSIQVFRRGRIVFLTVY